MKHEAKKITLLADEVIMMLLLHGMKDIDLNLKRESREYFINIVAKECNLSDKFIDTIKYTLEAPRQPELEDYYWQLAGDNEAVEELFVVGIMTDTAKVYKKDGNLHIELSRKI